MSDPGEIKAAWFALGRMLRDYRMAAGQSQEAFAPLVHYSRSTIANLETGNQSAPRSFWMLADEVLRAGGVLLGRHDEVAERVREHRRASAATRAVTRSATSILNAGPDLPPPPLTDAPDGHAGPVDALDPQLDRAGSRLARLAAALTTYDSPPPSAPLQSADLALAVIGAKRSYQAAQYSEVADLLPDLLAALNSSAGEAAGDEALRVQGLLAEAYQVTGSILVKLGDPGLAMLAADRSLAAAAASGDPVTVASSARIITHALMRSGHPRRAAAVAMDMAQRFDHDTSLPSQKALSVYGALLLRGASAAAHGEDRTTALTLIDEAASAAGRTGQDGNLRWTAFSPTNVLLHRVTLAVMLGDAGQAVEHARQVPLEQVLLTERRACLFLDVARAFTQWGKHDRAYRALRTAEDIAPQEMRRSSSHQLVLNLERSSPRTLRPHLLEMAERIGATR